MTAKTIDHSPQALAALSLVTAGAIGICASPTFSGKFIPAAVCGGMSALAIASAYGLHRKFDLAAADYKGGLNLALDGLETAYEGYVEPAVKKVVELESLPPALKTQAQRLIDINSDLRWVAQFFSKSFVACGVTNDGKTMFCQYGIARFLEKYPSATIRIHDCDLGKRDNWWLDLPALPAGMKGTGHEIVFQDIEHFYNLLTEAHQLFKERQQLTAQRKIGEIKPHLLMIAEMSNQLRHLESRPKAEKEPYLNMIKDLLFQGHGYKVFLGMESQSTACGVLNLTKAERQQLNMIALGSLAIKSTEVANLGADNAEELIQRVKTLRSTSAGKYAAIANIDGLGVGVHIVPAIDLSTIQIIVPESAIPEEVRWCDALAWCGIKKAMDANPDKGISFFWEAFGEGKQVTSNPKYVAFKTRFEQIKNQETDS